MKSAFIILLFVFLVSCDYDFVDKGPRIIDAVKSISRSKELGLFINEFKPKQICINDTLNFEIVSAWVEYNFYTSDIEYKYMKKENWKDGKEWKLKPNFSPCNRGHLSFIIKGDFEKRYKTYNEGWNLDYCQIVETKDTSFSNNFTYFQTYGPVSYDSLTNKIELHFEYYIPSEVPNKFGRWISFGNFEMVKK